MNNRPPPRVSSATTGDRHAHLGTVHKISDLAPYINGTKIIGVVVAKSELKKPASAGSDDAYALHNASFRFVVRDSVIDNINVVIRGTPAFVEDIFLIADIGSVVVVDNAEVASLNSNQSLAQYLPHTTSEVFLRVREGAANVLEFFGDPTPYANFPRIPTEPDGDIASLRDILSMDKENLDPPVLKHIIGIVKQVGSMRKFSRYGAPGSSTTCVLDVQLVDETLGGSDQSLPVEFWGTTKAYPPLSWPIGTVVMISSVQIRYDDYRRGVKGTVSDRCVVTVDPISRRANRLLAYLPHAELLKSTIWDAAPMTDPREVKGKFVQLEDFFKVLQTWILDPGRKTNTFAAWITGTPSGVDMSNKFIRRVCVNCKRTVWWRKEACTFKDCCFTRMTDDDVERALAPLSRTVEDPRIMLSYNFVVELFDEQCSVRLQITGRVGREVLQVSEEDFAALDDDARREVIEKFAFEEFNVLVRVRVPLARSIKEKRATSPRNLACMVVKMERLSYEESNKRKRMLEKRLARP